MTAARGSTDEPEPAGFPLGVDALPVRVTALGGTDLFRPNGMPWGQRLGNLVNPGPDR